MKRNAMKLTFKVCLFGGNSLAAKRRPLVKLPKLIPSLNQKFFLIICPKIFLFCIGMPENGNPVSQLVLRVAHPQKNAIFGSLKKNAILGPKGGKIVPQLTLGVHTISNLPTNRVKWRTAS